MTRDTVCPACGKQTRIIAGRLPERRPAQNRPGCGAAAEAGRQLLGQSRGSLFWFSAVPVLGVIAAAYLVGGLTALVVDGLALVAVATVLFVLSNS